MGSICIQTIQFSSVHSLNCVWLLVKTPRTAAHQASRSITNSYPLSQWCYPIISSSVVPFSCIQSFLASGSFPMSQFFTPVGQSIGTSASSRPLGAEKCSEHSRTKRRIKYEKQWLKSSKISCRAQTGPNHARVL